MAEPEQSKLLTAQLWLVEMRPFEHHDAVWNEWVQGMNAPVRGCGRADLARPGRLVEIKATAPR